MAFRSARESTKRKTEISDAQWASCARKRTKPGATNSTAASNGSKEKADGESNPDEALKVEEETGDIFAAPSNALIIHACNCQGSWGAGIAKAFKDRYPKAYSEYVRHCDENGDKLLDTAQLIPPVDAQGAGSETNAGATDVPKHFVGCLYTSRHYGRRRDTPTRILAATKPAMEHLLRQVNAWNAKSAQDARVGEVRICKINSGLFGVAWEDSKAVLERIDVAQSDVKKVRVISPPS